MKNIGDTLKKLREENGLTRKEVAGKLKHLGIDISDKTLYGYESGRNSANADMFLSLCKIYKCNTIMETFFETAEDILLTNKEWKMVEKYRDLDSHGKEMLDFTLLKEWERSVAEARSTGLIAPSAIRKDTNYISAAHPIENATDEANQHDEDIMDDENF